MFFEFPISNEPITLHEKEEILQKIQNNGRSDLKWTTDPHSKFWNEKEIVLALMKTGDMPRFHFISCRLRDDEEVVKEAIRHSNRHIFRASKRLQDDEAMVLFALEQNGDLLRKLPAKWQDNRQAVWMAFRSYQYALQYASERVLDDKKLIMHAVRQRGRYLKFASARLRDDEEVALASKHEFFSFCSSRLKNNCQVVQHAIQIHTSATNILGYAGPNVQRDKTTVMMAVQIRPGDIKYAAEPLRQDPEVILAGMKREMLYSCSFLRDQRFQSIFFIEDKLASVFERLSQRGEPVIENLYARPSPTEIGSRKRKRVAEEENAEEENFDCSRWAKDKWHSVWLVSQFRTTQGRSIGAVEEVRQAILEYSGIPNNFREVPFLSRYEQVINNLILKGYRPKETKQRNTRR